MRIPTLLVLCLLCPSALAASENSDLAGVWTGWQCPSGVAREPGKCANFVLELFQKDGKLCGTHVFSTAGAAQMDEGGEMPSIHGELVDGVATATVRSGRSPVQIRAEMRLVNGRLLWRRLDSPDGDYLLPLSTRLTRSPHRSLRTPVLERQLRSACYARFSMVAVEPQPAPTSQPLQPAPARD